jgi:hypothetical protein
VPGGMVPDHDQRLLAVVGQPFGQPPALLGWSRAGLDAPPRSDCAWHGYPRATSRRRRALWGRDRLGPRLAAPSDAASCQSRRAGRGGPRGSTTLHRQTRLSPRGASGPMACAEHAAFFARVLRLRTGDPVRGALPVGAHALDGPASRCITQRPDGQAVRVAALGGQSERPPSRRLAKVPRGLR